MSELDQALIEMLASLQSKIKTWTALLGDGNGVVSVPNAEKKVYVRMPDGNSAIVFNDDRVPLTYNLPVVIGYDYINPTLLQVLGVRQAYKGEESGAYAARGAHHASHEWLADYGGQDVVYAHARQFLPARLTVISGLVVGMYDSPVATDTGWKGAGQFTLDLASFVPGSGAVFVLVSQASDGSLVGTAGAAQTSKSVLSVADIPVTPTGHRPVAAVMLEAGQTVVKEDKYTQDVVDLRFPGVATSASSPLPTFAPNSVIVSDPTGNLADINPGLTIEPIYRTFRVSTSASTPGTYGAVGVVAEGDAMFAPPEVDSVYASSDYPADVGPVLGMYRARGTSPAPTPVQTDDDLGDITWAGRYYTSTEPTGGWYKTAKIRGIASENWDAGSHQGSKIQVFTSQNGAGYNRPVVEFGDDGNLYRVTDGDLKMFPYLPAAALGYFLRDDGTWHATGGGSGSVATNAPITGNGLGGSPISISAATSASAGTMSAADKAKLDGIASGATAAYLDATLPQAIGTAATGTSASGAHGDHVHAHGNQPGGLAHAVFTSASAGFVPATSASAGKFLRDDATWQTAGGGTVTVDAPLTGDGSSGSHLAIANFSTGAKGTVPGPAAANATEWDTLRGSGAWYWGNKRTVPAGVTVDIPADCSVVVSSYFTVSAGATLIIEAGASLEIR